MKRANVSKKTLFSILDEIKEIKARSEKGSETSMLRHLKQAFC